MSAGVVVVTFPQADKVLFPAIPRIITGLNYAADYQALTRLIRLAPVYLYTFAPPEHVRKILIPKFNKYGLRLDNGRIVFKERWMWRVASF